MFSFIACVIALVICLVLAVLFSIPGQPPTTSKEVDDAHTKQTATIFLWVTAAVLLVAAIATGVGVFGGQ